MLVSVVAKWCFSAASVDPFQKIYLTAMPQVNVILHILSHDVAEILLMTDMNLTRKFIYFPTLTYFIVFSIEFIIRRV